MGDTDVDLYGEDLPEDTGELQALIVDCSVQGIRIVHVNLGRRLDP